MVFEIILEPSLSFGMREGEMSNDEKEGENSGH